MTYHQQRAKGLTFNKHLLKSIEKELTAICQQELAAIFKSYELHRENYFLELLGLLHDSQKWAKLCFQRDTTARIIKELEAE